MAIAWQKGHMPKNMDFLVFSGKVPPMTQQDRNTLSGRIGRYAKVSKTMAGLAARLAGEKYLGMTIERDKHARDLMDALGNLKGPLMKIAQILATIPEALPEEYSRELRALQADAPPMGWPFVRRRMKTELGADWQDQFSSFSKEAAAAASLGQVHKAVHQDGRQLACKLQYPDMQSAISADLKQLKLIFSLFEKYDKAIQTKYIHEELSERLHEELDYKLEAKYCQMYRHMLADEKKVFIPEVIEDLSTDRLLASTWLDGRGIFEYVDDAPLEQRNDIAMNLFRAWYVPLYYYGVIHGDPHPGNYTVRDDHSINLLDFGCCRVFPPSFVQGVILLYRALQDNDTEAAVHAYETWGFKDLSKDLVEVLNVWARFLYGPILEDKARAIGEAEGGIYGRETAEKVHASLRDLGGVTIPREFVFMDRAALGLGSIFIHLKAEVNWYRIFNEMIVGFDVAALEQRQAEVLSKFDIS